MKIIQVPMTTFAANCYLVATEQNNCVIIDPGAQPQSITRMLHQHQLTPKMILLTHGHFDHIGAVNPLLETFGPLPTYMGEKDLELVQDPEKSMASSFHQNPNKFILDITRALKEGDTVSLDELTFTVIETPGHTKGSVCYLCEDALFSGDTLFLHDYGRTDLYGGSLSDILDSLGKLAALKGEYTVYPGHEDFTTLAAERPYIESVLAANPTW